MQLEAPQSGHRGSGPRSRPWHSRCGRLNCSFWICPGHGQYINPETTRNEHEKAGPGCSLVASLWVPSSCTRGTRPSHAASAGTRTGRAGRDRCSSAQNAGTRQTQTGTLRSTSRDADTTSSAHGRQRESGGGRDARPGGKPERKQDRDSGRRRRVALRSKPAPTPATCLKTPQETPRRRPDCQPMDISPNR